jgi:hyaluronan synthase
MKRKPGSWLYTKEEVRARRPRNRKAANGDTDHPRVRRGDGHVHAGVPVLVPPRQGIRGCLNESYDIPEVRFRYKPVIFMGIASVLIAAAMLWRLRSGFTNISTGPLIALVPLFVLRSLGWVLSCFDHPVEESSDFDKHILDSLVVAASVPTKNEDVGLFDRCIFGLVNGSRAPDYIDIIDDGTDPTKVDYTDLRAHWEGYHTTRDGQNILITWHTNEENIGKRRSHCHTFVGTPADIYLTVDSDTTVLHNSVEEILKPFLDPEVMSVAGIELGFNASRNFLTVMQNSLQQVAQAVISAAWSTTGRMFTNRGPFAAYRQEMIEKIVPLYWGETFAGRRIVLGDDSLLALAGSRYGKAVQQLSAFGLTMWPETLYHHLRQRLRWGRGRTVRNCWRAKYYPFFSYIYWFTAASIYSFLAGLSALVVLTVDWPKDEHLVLRIIGASMVLSIISQFRVFCFKRSDETWIDRVLIIAVRPIASIWASVVLTRLVRAYATVTFLKQGWTTRKDGAELVLEAEEDIEEVPELEEIPAV